jgi:hypothetical protein
MPLHANVRSNKVLGIVETEIPKATITTCWIKRRLAYLVDSAETGWKHGNKERMEAGLQEFRELASIAPTRSFTDLEERWDGQSDKKAAEALKTTRQTERTTIRRTHDSRKWLKQVSYADQTQRPPPSTKLLPAPERNIGETGLSNSS